MAGSLAWRHREAVPKELWRRIVPLAQAHSVSPVARALRLNYTALRFIGAYLAAAASEKRVASSRILRRSSLPVPRSGKASR